MKKISLKVLSSVLSLTTLFSVMACGDSSMEVFAKENGMSTKAKFGIGLTCGAGVIGAGAFILYSLLHNNSGSGSESGSVSGSRSGTKTEKTTNTIKTSSEGDTRSKFYVRAEPVCLLKLDINAHVGLDNVEIVESGESKKISGITDDSLLNKISKDKKVGIIDAANCKGLGGGGVDGVIFNAMGEKVACTWLQNNVPAYKNGDRIREGGALLHSGFGITDKYKNIPYVIQAVSPILNDDNDLALLYSAYYNAVKLGLDNGCEILVVPAVGMGIFCNDKTDKFGTKCGNVAAQAIVKAQKDCNKKARIIFTDHYDSRRNRATEAFFKQMTVLGAKRV